MARLVRAGKTSMPVRTTAMRVVEHLPNKAYIAEVETIWRWVRDHIRYVRDVEGVETVQTPERTLQLGGGDCDDQSVLINSMLASLGFKTRFAALAFTPGRYSHVFGEVLIFLPNGKRKWIPLETTERKPFGWYPGRPHQRMVVTV